MDVVANVLSLLLLWFVYEASVWLRARLREEEDASVSLCCPRREERIEIASEETQVTWSEPDNNCHGYRCDECGNIHTWIWGLPAPVYSGDKFRFRITSEGMVEA